MKISWKLGPLDQEEKFRSFFWLEDSGVARATALDKEGIHANHSSFSLRNSLSLSLSLSLFLSYSHGGREASKEIGQLGVQGGSIGRQPHYEIRLAVFRQWLSVAGSWNF